MIWKWLYGPENVSGLSRNGPLARSLTERTEMFVDQNRIFSHRRFTCTAGIRQRQVVIIKRKNGDSALRAKPLLWNRWQHVFGVKNLCALSMCYVKTHRADASFVVFSNGLSQLEVLAADCLGTAGLGLTEMPPPWSNSWLDAQEFESSKDAVLVISWLSCG